MKDRLTQTIHNGVRYEVPYHEMGSWLAYIRDLSFFQLDCGHLQIAFSDKFSKYKKKTT